MSEEAEEPEVKEEIETEELEEAVEEKPKKPEKPKAQKKKKEEKGAFSYYKIDEKEGLTRLRPFCERCGPGYFMADHGNRYTCGHCGFTRYKQNQQ